MGQKIRPDSYRTGVTRGWNSRWFPKKKNFKKTLEEDVLIRKIVKEKIKLAGIDKIEIEKNNNTFRVFIKVAKPGLVIGRGGKGVEDLRKAIESKLAKLYAERNEKPDFNVNLNIEELKRNEVSSAFIAQSIAWDLEKRMTFRRTIKKYLESIMQNKEVEGAKIKLSGRLDGGEIARREWLAKGKLPLQTLRANIDYGEGTAFCTYGTVGIKVWIYKGEVHV
ncbi:MAG: 30S ribosomal protein S3 [Patescibacteria group bacterium]|nr:30S ribosomal protein S3 [Patescibacteria group bacterium]